MELSRGWGEAALGLLEQRGSRVGLPGRTWPQEPCDGALGGDSLGQGEQERPGRPAELGRQADLGGVSEVGLTGSGAWERRAGGLGIWAGGG